MKGSLLVLFSCLSALAAISNGFNFKAVLPSYKPAIRTFEVQPSESCADGYDGQYKPYKDAFSCVNRTNEFCICAAGKLNENLFTTVKEDYVRYCGSCEMGFRAKSSDYASLQTLNSWKKLNIDLSKLSVADYEGAFGRYNQIVLPGGIEQDVDAFGLMVNDFFFAMKLSSLGDEQTFHLIRIKSITNFMAEAAPFLQNIAEHFRNLIYFRTDVKLKCLSIRRRSRFLFRNYVDVMTCLKNGTVVARPNQPDQVASNSSQEEACKTLEKDSKVFETFGAKRREAAMGVCAFFPLVN